MTSFYENKAEVLAPAHIDVETLFVALKREGVAVTSGVGLQIVVADFPCDAGLAEVETRSKTLGRPWLLITVAGEHAGVGPLFVPDRGPCWSCLLRRMWLNGHATSADNRRADAAPIFDVA